MVFADGDRAVKEFLLTYEEQVKEKPVEDNYRPVIVGSNFINKNILSLCAKFNLMVCFRIDELMENYDELKSYFGNLKMKKLIPLSICKKNGLKNLLCSTNNFDSFNVYKFLVQKDKKHNKLFGRKNVFDHQEILEMLTTTPAYYAFDLEQKGSFDSGKKANFLVLNKTLENENVEVEQIYLEGELIYEGNKK